MHSLEFCFSYYNYLNDLEKVIDPKYQNIIEDMRNSDPSNLIEPERIIRYTSEALGIVYKDFIYRVNRSIKDKGGS